MFDSSLRRRAFRALLESEGLDRRESVVAVPRPPDGVMSLSFAQERLWLVDRLGGSVAYNVPFALRLRGGLRAEVLRRALGFVVERHEVLRTCYPVVGGVPVQRVLPGAGFEWWVRDVAQCGGFAAGWELAVEEARRPFDLVAGPVLRAGVVRVGEQDHLFLLTVHHIAADGWSSGVLAGEVLALYEALAEGGSAASAGLAALPVQYADFAAWQRRWLQGEVLEEQLAYWRARLAGMQLVELPSDRRRPGALSGEGMTRRFELSAGLSDRLRGLARREGVTLFMVLIAGFYAALSRLTGQTDLAIGTQIANRNRLEIEPLIGFFVNTLVLRADLSGDPSFRDLLGRVRETTLGAYAHQDLPLERLVADLPGDRPRGGMTGEPFNVCFQFDDARAEPPRPAGISIDVLDIDKHAAKFPLLVTMFAAGEHLAADVEYQVAFIEQDVLTRLMELFRGCLSDMVIDAGAHLGEVGDGPRPRAEGSHDVDAYR
jgi:Condensation domain